MVGNHQAKEHAIELSTLKRGKLRQLLRGRHAGHLRMVHHRMHRVIHAGVIHPRMIHAHHHGLFAAIRQPLVHEFDFVGLARKDAAGNSDDFLIIGAILNQPGHVHGLLMMDDHALHESHVGFDIGCLGQFRRFFSGQSAAGLTRSTRLHDRRRLRHRERRSAQQHGSENSARTRNSVAWCNHDSPC